MYQTLICAKSHVATSFQLALVQRRQGYSSWWVM